jgi:4-hydroxy-2-oxoheptanedioate aldolase
VIRVPSNEPHLVLRALDTGSGGVQVPHVSTVEEARLAVENSKYYPEGKRGFTPFTRAGRYGTDAEGYAKKANDETIVVVNVEGKEGIGNLGEITGVKGIDVIFIGPYDLSQSIGKPGEVEDPQVIKAIRGAAELAREKGMACGSYARDLKYLDILIDCGVQYVTYTVDSALVTRAYRELYEKFNSKTGEFNEQIKTA